MKWYLIKKIIISVVIFGMFFQTIWKPQQKRRIIKLIFKNTNIVVIE
jgi:preprotein translocase subunit YajC